MKASTPVHYIIRLVPCRDGSIAHLLDVRFLSFLFNVGGAWGPRVN